jgi:hypothetical protein
MRTSSLGRWRAPTGRASLLPTTIKRPRGAGTPKPGGSIQLTVRQDA